MEITKKLIIRNQNGLHTRPASKIVCLAEKFKSEIKLHRVDEENKVADCKSALSLLLLSANKGTELILSGKGADAHLAVEEIANYFNRNFDEIL